MSTLELFQYQFVKGEKSEKIAFVEVSLYGSAPKPAYDKLTSEICAILGKELGVRADKIYVKYSPTDNWGVERRKLLMTAR